MAQSQLRNPHYFNGRVTAQQFPSPDVRCDTCGLSCSRLGGAIYVAPPFDVTLCCNCAILIQTELKGAITWLGSSTSDTPDDAPPAESI